MQRLVPTFVLSVAFLLIFPERWQSWVPMSTMVIVFASLLFLLPLVTQRGKGTYLQKLEALEASDTRKQVFLDVVARPLGRGVVDLAFWLGMILWIAFLAGQGAARHQQEWLILADSSNTVVLRTYGGKLVTAPLDREKRTVAKPYSVHHESAITSLGLRLENVGPIRLQQK
jgi:hypothetical protein